MNDLKILVIDGNPDDLTAIRAVISDSLPGTKVLTARDGCEGIELALVDAPDVILLDVVMPRMDGYVVCRKIKQNEVLADIPVFFLTAVKTDLESRIKALEMGAEGFLAKPFNEVELIAQIKAMAKIKQSHRRERQMKIQLAALVTERTHELERELSRRKHIETANQMLIQETQDRYHEISALMRASRAVLENSDFQSSARLILRECKQQLGARSGFIALLSRDDARNEVLLTESVDGTDILAGDLSMPMRGFFAEIYRTGKAVFDNDLQNCAWIQSLPKGHMILDNVIFAPMPVHGKVVGLIGLANKRGGFAVDDMRIATGFGEIAALALTSSRNLESLENSEIRFRSLVETATDAIVSIDAKGSITHWNRGAENIFGYTAVETMGKDINMIVPANMQKAHTSARTRTLASGQLPHSGISREVVALKKDGTEFPVELTLSRWQTGEGVFFTSIIRDITERKKQEQTRVMLQAQLNHAQRMEAIGTLAGGIAHDFNNILAAILGYAEMAQEDSLQGSIVKKDIDQVIKAGHRAKELVKQILAFSRQTESEKIPIQTATIVTEAIKMLRSFLPTTIDINKSIDPNAGLILADPTQINQILMNLCTNAFHAMEDVGGSLSISLKNRKLTQDDLLNEPQVQPGDFVQLSVGDTGAGIPPEIRERIFDPYFTTKEVGKGTGLGLSIIHGIVKSSGGIVSYQSQPGEGTVFHILLPAITNTDLPENSQEELVQAGNEHILFIDDEAMLAEMAKLMLERLGYRVTTQTNGIEALTTFRNSPDEFDLVITDQTMPGMTGGDLAHRLLQIRPSLPIILCTGYSSQISEEKAKSLGIKGFGKKPLAQKDIASLIRNVLDREGKADVTS